MKVGQVYQQGETKTLKFILLIAGISKEFKGE